MKETRRASTDRLSTYVPVGNLGYGFPDASLEAATKYPLAAIAVDAGSTDPGPYYLGTGTSYTSDVMVTHDLARMLKAARRLEVPLLVGSAGGAGADEHLERVVSLVREIAANAGLHFRMAIIHGELSADYVRRALREGRIEDFEAGRDLTEADIDASRHIVAQMGVEPFLDALDQGADVVIAGRAFDAAIAAALPILRGYDPGLAYHMGKIVECGSLVALPRTHDGVLSHMEPDSFIIEPADPQKRTTVDLVSAHTLYEKSNPEHLLIPGGELDLSDTTFEQVGPRTVRVSGTRFVPRPYTVKLEGSARIGARSVCIAGVRDPGMIANLDSVIGAVRRKVDRDISGAVERYSLIFRVYGRDGVMGSREPHPAANPVEIALLIEVVSETQASADAVAALARSATLHMGFDGRLNTAGNLAFPFSPAEFAAPEAFEFRVYHLMRVDDPCEVFPMEWIQL